MADQNEPTIRVSESEDYNDLYSNSVQIKMSVWDFHLVFGTMSSASPEEVSFTSKQGIYLSPQQAKALFNILGQNLAQYEATFGELKLEPTYNGNNGSAQNAGSVN